MPEICPDLQTVLDGVAESAVRLCGADDIAIGLVEGDRLRFCAHAGPLATQVPGRLVRLNRETSITGGAVQDKRIGVGIASGYATLGQIGFEGRFDHAAIGTVTNTAARLCGEAADGRVLVTQRISAAVEGAIHLEPIGDLELKGLVRPIAAYNALREAEPSSARD